MRKRRLLMGLGLLVALAPIAACTGSEPNTSTPGLAPRGTVMTTAKPTRQDLTNRLSLTGKVTINPVFGVVAPLAGQIRYSTVKAPTGTPTKPTKVGSIYVKGKSHKVEIPARSVFAGRLVDDRSTVPAGMPVVSARHIGYGIVAEIDGAQAYKISSALTSVRAQIQDGPGPFTCTVLGTIAALPAGTIPDPPAPPVQPQPSGSPTAPPPVVKEPVDDGLDPSEATGMRLVCLAPAAVKLINGAGVTLELVTAKASNVLVLPVEAVAGGQGTGMVDVVKPDGTRESRQVVLGMTDGKVIEIKSGLTEDETVAIPGPDLPAAPPDNNKGGDPGFPVTK